MGRAQLFILAAALLCGAGYLLSNFSSAKRAETIAQSDESRTPEKGSRGEPFGSDEPPRPVAPEIGASTGTPARLRKPNLPAEITEAWLKAQSFDIQATLLSGFDLEGFDSFAAYYQHLEEAAMSGEPGAVARLSKLMRRCKNIVSNEQSRTNPSAPNYAAAQACSSIPLADGDEIANLVLEAARGGDTDAILLLIEHPPSSVTLAPGSVEANQWGTELASLLQPLVERGNVNAALLLANLHATDAYGTRDFERAIRLYQTFLQGVPAIDPRRRSVEISFARLCNAATSSEGSRPLECR